MLLDYASFYGEQVEPAPTPAPWFPLPRKQREPEKVRVTCSVDAVLPAPVITATLRMRVMAHVTATLPVPRLGVRLNARSLDDIADDEECFEAAAALLAALWLNVDDDDDEW